MAEPTSQERAAFLWMQGRMIELLLRHDAPRFAKTFGKRAADTAEDEALRRLRELAVVFYLRDELFHAILPRITRRLSFVAPHDLVVEAPPARGRIDWARTVAAGLRDRPGEAPLEALTRQRRRHFATPENVLTVATLLEFREDGRRLLDAEATQDSARAIRHPLHEIVDACTRALVFPQFATLVHECEAILDGRREQTIAELEQRVEAQQLPGRNSAYDDLLAWRRKRAALRLLDRTAALQPTPMLGADPARDNYLYQIWIFYELADMLAQTGKLVAWQPGAMTLKFCWGAEQQHYRLQHDRGIDKHWPQAPGVRPDLYVARADDEPLRDTVRDAAGNGQPITIWHSPGYLLDAKYYKPRDGARAPASPVKRMIADLQLTGERHGALLFAFLEQPQPADEIDVVEHALRDMPVIPLEPLYRVGRDPRTGYAASDIEVGIWRLQPHSGADAQHLRPALHALLDAVHQALRSTPPIACHGFLPDVDTINPGGTAPERCTRCNELLAFCPKPHVGRNQIDRVCPRCDCLRSQRLCHIIGRGVYSAPPFVRRVLSRDELIASVKTLREWVKQRVAEGDDGEPAEQARGQLLRSIGELTESYVRLTRADTAGAERKFREWIFGEYWSEEQHARGLAKTPRDMLISGEYVWEQFQGSTIDDWAACAVQYTRALEFEIHRRLYEPCGTRLVTREGKEMLSHQFTIGTVIFLLHTRGSNNWATLLECVARPSGISEQDLEAILIDIRRLRNDRNKVAHTAHVDRTLATNIRAAVLGTRSATGLLYRICSMLAAP